MINRFIIIFFLILSGYMDLPKRGHKPSASVNSYLQHLDNKREIKIERSLVEWKGTKFRGKGSHSGKVFFKEGYLLFEDHELSGGEFIVDMRSIYNTDIPLSDPVPRKNLTTHLNSDFETARYPTAKFFITNVLQGTPGLMIYGDLTIRGISRKISIQAHKIAPDKFVSEFNINRFDWKIGDNGSWLEKKLVDPDIRLKVTIICDPEQ